ncbi:hypothetical protein J2Z21_007328 [Streptomyces griseochromogenes]|uniref:Uncharacterized protein n=1 Tax=Streptomyces griseochromogenes TaxID=68214 RepID=A0ABS4M3S1_9ACTN|nr:ALQxL family class IV lanthipeptide [Streptomyces griseochromogenes]MBP2054325.1 hypothetical protein [Streptomyces griseochromogenes]
MEFDVNALQHLQEEEPETGLYPCTWTCPWTSTSAED